LSDVGFVDVKGLDKTDDFLRILKEEVERFEPTKEEFLKEFSQKDFDDLVSMS
jgi:phosphoethanolamine N-methyltransferase